MHLEKAHTANLPNFTTVLQIIEDLVPCFELNGEFADKYRKTRTADRFVR